ncbi:MAG: hypothetical protein ABI693_29555 [Bryobacteraceae bacterium]
MKLIALIGALFIAGIPAAAQHNKLGTVNTETPEGQMLQAIGQENDPAKKTTMLEDFTGKYPKHESAGWANAQLVTLYSKAGQVDKALAAGDRAIASDPDDLDTALVALKALEAGKDPDSIRKWSVITSDAARKVVSGEKPADVEADEWKQRVDYAKQVDTYCDYAFYASALSSTNPVKTIDLFETLEKRSPQSQYVAQTTPVYFRALVQAKQMEKAVALTEKYAAQNQADENMLVTAADYYFTKQNNDKTIAMALKTIEVLTPKGAPTGVDPAAWEKDKKTKLGAAHWYAGMAYANQSKFQQADTELRAALPNIEGQDYLKGGALFTLGLANFKMGDAAKGDTGSKHVLDAFRFSQQAATIKSPWQPLAAKNVAAIKTQYHLK